MILIINFKQLDMNIMNNDKYSFYLNGVTAGILPLVLRTCDAVQIRSGPCVRGKYENIHLHRYHLGTCMWTKLSK